MATFQDGDKTWTLSRRPRLSDDPLQPWDAADTYLLRELRDRELAQAEGSLLIVNDAFGALGVALASHAPQWWSDSYRSWRALTENLVDNGLDAQVIRHVPGDQDPVGPVDLVVIKVPKSLSKLEDQLLRLRPHLREGATVVAGSMIKKTPKRVYDLLEACIGPTTTSLGWKKARLAFATYDAALDCPPGLEAKASEVPGFEVPLLSRPGIFSWEKLDLGSRLLLDHLDRLPMRGAAPTVVDLGCGNGVLAFALARAYPAATVIGVDESYQAIASARANVGPQGVDPARVRFVVADQLEDVGEDGLDLVQVDAIVCNPPFHHGHAIGDHLAWDLFVQSRAALRPGGTLLVVGNRHLRYNEKLVRLNANCTMVSANPKFSVLRVTR